MPAVALKPADAIQSDVDAYLTQCSLTYKKLSLDEKLEIFLTLAVERMATGLGTSWKSLRPHVTDYIGFGASIYERHHTMDITRKAGFLGLVDIELHSVDLGGASMPAALELARRLCESEERLVLIAGSEVPRGGPTGIQYYREASAALLDAATERASEANLIALYALLADRLQFETGVTKADAQAITAHYRAVAQNNKRAAMSGKILKDGDLDRTLAGIYSTPMVAVATDHGAALVVGSEALLQKLARSLRLQLAHNTLYLNSYGMSFVQKYITHREDFSSPGKRAAERAFARTTIAPHDIDYAWIYDCFTLMLVRQAADYFSLAAAEVAKTLAAGYINVAGKRIMVNQLGGILNTQAAISLSAASGIVDIFAYAEENPTAQHFLFGGNGGIDTVNAVMLLSRKPYESKLAELKSEVRSTTTPRAIVDGEKATIFASALVRFNPGSDVPFMLVAAKRNDGALCLARLHNADLTPCLQSEFLRHDATLVTLANRDNHSIAVLEN